MENLSVKMLIYGVVLANPLACLVEVPVLEIVRQLSMMMLG
jgi:hypothetical protein